MDDNYWMEHATLPEQIEALPGVMEAIEAKMQDVPSTGDIQLCRRAEFILAAIRNLAQTRLNFFRGLLTSPDAKERLRPYIGVMIFEIISDVRSASISLIVAQMENELNDRSRTLPDTTAMRDADDL